ncbi:aminoacyl-tRNA deacylase [Shewanella sp. UCD-FRSSP16_17]|uniref:Cys-tRNA(Pro) deacylase n=1 Tax=unclassified Shewanella TaxID=196818 RepID=UPI0007EECD2D|nr:MULTISPECIES: Cys-tRNA(Pro) deacylase [unclassified Shewanella]MBQ4889805.1 Cys-tRNA(Pro) deacylase [Shewanella sp. MMG014]OBT10606.1 aminoacyl-tRNA deacylase [Shewanella sp. UCD-FRSSP16_17]
MTPAINLLEREGISHQVLSYQHEASAQSYGDEAVTKLNLCAEQVFKTLVVQLDNGTLAVAITPVSSKLNLKQMAKSVRVKKVVMADKQRVEKATGYVLGGVSPLGQKKRLPTVIDVSAEQFDVIYVSAGKRGLEIGLSPISLCALTQGSFASITQ